MSWAEVKKAVNSNIDVPLDARMSCGFVKTMYNHGTGVGPSLNIQGKGVLNHVWYQESTAPSAMSPRLIITVDDNVIFDKCVNNTNTNRGGDTRLGFVSSVFLTQTSGTVVGGGLYDTGSYISVGECVIPRYTVYVEMSSSPETCIVTGNAIGYYFIVTDKPLAFNKSLKIETIGTTTQAASYFIQYELYE